jgi:hypothetical protein
MFGLKFYIKIQIGYRVAASKFCKKGDSLHKILFVIRIRITLMKFSRQVLTLTKLFNFFAGQMD